MYKKFKFSLILFSLVLLVLSGCQDQSSNGSVQGPYRISGNQMVEAKFAPYAPVTLQNDPYKKGEDIDVAVELTNKHTEDIPEGNVKVRLTGDAAIPAFFQGAQIVTAPELRAYDIISNRGLSEEVELGPLTYVGEIPTEVSKKITGEYCYQYPVKVKGFLYYTDNSQDMGINLPSGSNPPSSLQVTSITQRPVNIQDNEGTLRFRVTVRNIGNGVLVGSLNDCFKYREIREREYFTIIAEGAYPMTCENDGYVRLSRETREKVVDCTVSGIDLMNINKEPSELTLTLTNFAYEEPIPSVNVWLEP